MIAAALAVRVLSSAPTPSPSRPRTGLDAGEMIHSVWTGIWSAVSSAPWVGVLLALALLGGVVRFIRSVIHSGPRDPVRRFCAADKREILRRAGGRCEHHSLIFGRCPVTEHLEADHVHPHSRGGWTNLANGQALCRRHNRIKRATVPFDFQLRTLERHRAAYFPATVSGAVVRRHR